MERDNRANRTTPETRERAVRMVFDNLGSYPDRATAIRAIAPKIGCSRESLRRWVAQAETDSGTRQGTTSGERARREPLCAIGSRTMASDLEREVRELRQANEILTEEDQENVRWTFPPTKGEPMSRQWSERHWRTPISPRRSLVLQESGRV